MSFPVGTRIRNVEKSGREDDGVKKEQGVSSWIQLLAKHAPELDRAKVEECAMYTLGVCKLPKGNETLYGAHVKLEEDPHVYIIPLCTSHNNSLRAANLQMKATRAFPAFQLPDEALDRKLALERAESHCTALKADLKQLDMNADIDALF